MFRSQKTHLLVLFILLCLTAVSLFLLPVPSSAIQLMYEETDRENAGSGRTFSDRGFLHDKLSNGLEYLIEERPFTETVSLSICIRGGAKAEKEEMVGLSRFLASMLMKGTEKMGGDEIARILESRGVRYGAYSDYLFTEISSYMPSGEFTKAFEVLSDCALHPAFHEEEIEKEKKVKTGNLESYKDFPSGIFEHELMKALFPHHPLGYSPPYTPVSLNLMNRESLISFHSRYFVPNNMLIVIVGNISADLAVEQIKKLYGDMDPSEIPPAKFSSEESHIPSGIQKRINKRTTEALIWVGFRIEGIDDNDIPTLIILNGILGQFQMRLFHEIREKRGYAYWVRVDAMNFPDASLWNVESGIQRKYLKEVEGIIKTELMKIAGEPVTDDELGTVKRFTKTSFSRRMEINSNRGDYYAALLIKGRSLLSEEERLKKFDQVTKEDILNLASRLFKNRNFSIFTLH